MSQLLIAWVLTDDRPRLLLDDSGWVIWTNGQADKWLSAARDLRRASGKLAIADPSQSSEFIRFCRNAGEAESTWCYRRSTGGALLFRAVRLHSDQAVSFVGLQFQDADPEAHVAWADFSRLFGLTRTEHLVVLHLLNGEDVHHIAAERGLSEGTVRTHIKHAYSKIGINNREQLFHMLAPFRMD